MEYFLKQLEEFTPNINKNKNYTNYTKNLKSLNVTQNYYNESKNISAIEIKEFSYLCIILKNLSFFAENINMLNSVKFITKENLLIFEKIKKELEEKQNKVNLSNIDVDKLIIEKIFKFASIKFLLDLDNVDKNKISDLLEEISRDLKNFELEARIEELESKFAKDFSENTFNELKELKKLQKIN